MISNHKKQKQNSKGFGESQKGSNFTSRWVTNLSLSPMRFFALFSNLTLIHVSNSCNFHSFIENSTMVIVFVQSSWMFARNCKLLGSNQSQHIYHFPFSCPSQLTLTCLVSISRWRIFTESFPITHIFIF